MFQWKGTLKSNYISAVAKCKINRGNGWSNLIWVISRVRIQLYNWQGFYHSLQYQYIQSRWYNCLVRGRPFDPEEGAWQIWSGQIIYFQHELGQKIYFQVNQGQKIYFQPQQIFEKAKKGVVQGFRRGGRIWLSMFCITFYRRLARNIAYLVARMFWYWLLQYLCV